MPPADLMLDKCPVCGKLHNTAVEGAACDACEENTLAEQDAFGDPIDDDTDEGPCWCGEEDPLYSDLPDTCGGSGVLYCYCGGDFCICHWHGEVECNGCENCNDEWADGDFDDLDGDMVGEVDDADEG